ncbi:lantibiotic dehydratase [Streptomyces sp. CMB-StM0423]|uniref:lantibiotic dehydratase n=1 Tax=Streptomyces sp. CMB-StM0423 TaxID=2059884 RepID=UPI00131E33CC|nr:lantibiotic dehydratase [Streptomyces sp. CMB-StM0423]
MRTVFDSQPMAMARIPLRPYFAPSDDEDTGERGILDEGIYLASRSAADAAATARGRMTRRAYDLRSRTRTTPHGVFAGVAPALLGALTVTLQLSADHRPFTTPNPAWLAAVTDRLLGTEPSLLYALTVTSATLARLRGDRWEIEHPTPDGSRRSSVRATEVSTWLLHAAHDGARAGDLIAELSLRHPSTPAERVADAVQQMINSGLLLTDLLPVGSGVDPLRHVLAKLPPEASARPDLERLAELLHNADIFPPGAMPRRKLLREATGLADALHHSPRQLAVDTLADANIALPSSVARRAAEAASLLWRIGHRAGPLTDYHQRFCAEYGRHRLVTLLDVLDPVTGLGEPRPRDALGLDEGLDPQRTEVLARLLSDTLIGGADELVLTEDDIDPLANPSPLPPPRTAEIHIQLLHGATGLKIAVCPATGSQDAGAAPGRFTRYLPDLAPDEAHDPGNGPMIAEIVCRSRTVRATALAVETGTAPWRIPLDVPTRPDDLLPADLALGTTGDHLQLWSTSHDRPVIPVLYSRLAPKLLPPAAHLLHLLGHTGTRPWHPWHWGPFAAFPHTPRVRYRDTLLTPARWLLPTRVAAAADDRATFEAHLATWRTSARPTPPPVLVTEEVDRRLPLDLDNAEEREILRRSIRRGTRTLAEPLAAPEQLAAVDGPTGRHLIDLVVPLTRRHTPQPTPPDPRRALRRHPPASFHLPGSTWLSAALAAPSHLHDTLLAHLAPLLDDLTGDADRWFFLRYTTPALGPHLRLRFHGTPHTLATRIQPRLSNAADALHRTGLLRTLLLEPYEQEVERYGGPDAITVAEAVFTADSRLALQAVHRTPDERLLLAVACATDIARSLAPGQERTALRPGRLTADQRRHRDALRPHLGDGAASLIPTEMTTAHAELRAALADYRDTLAPQVAARCASDVIHMHANRLLAGGPETERIARTLSADLLHRRA